MTGKTELNAATATTNASGLIEMNLTDRTGETVTVMAKAQNNRGDVGKPPG
ncbi:MULTISPECIES: hypothetical protein [Enterobacter cloacae complex]|uniref:hypothetical protein n=1 Tax=Enterobacter cloacae complex TaxID=354276 RepID=UPI002788F3DF|nr:hypothetical protein [Enterobacter roggenkampii]